MYSSIKQHAAAFALVAATSSAIAVPSNQLVSWNADASADGMQSGTLGGIDVSVSQFIFDNPNYESSYGGGTTTNIDWSGVESFEDIAPSWDMQSGQQAAVLEWSGGDSVFVQVSFSQEITDPVLFFTGMSARSGRGQDFGFDFSAVLNLIATDLSGQASINNSNNHLVTIDGSDRGAYDNGVAVELQGTYDSLFFLANSQRDIADTALFTLGASVDSANPSAFNANSFSTVPRFAFASNARGAAPSNISAVPEPAPFALFLAGAFALMFARRTVAVQAS